MSSLHSTKPPAYAGLRARPLAPAPADDAIAARLNALCGDGEIDLLDSNLAPPAGFYLLRRRGGGPVFLKLLPEAEAARQIAADRFARHALRHGVPAAVVLPGFPKALSGALSLVGYDWMPGRFARGDEADCGAVGRLLARLHQALAAFPDADAVRGAAERRLRDLEVAAEGIRGGALRPPRRAEELRRLLASSADPFAAMREEPRQTIHGDLNHGNVLFPTDGGEPIALDYEDAAISWLPPALDVAYALERFALVLAADDAGAAAAARALLAAYAGETGAPIFSGRGALADILRMLALRSLTQLAMATSEGAAPAPGEWDKFHFLHGQAEARSALLAELEAPHLALR